MNKQEFLEELWVELGSLPEGETEERLEFYSEMIEDRMEEGLTEEEAVAEIGTPKEVAAQIIAEIPLPKLVVEKVRPKRTLKAWEIVLLVLGSPVWVPLLLAAIILALAAYIVVWALIVVLWAVEAALAVSSAAGVILGFWGIFHGSIPEGIAAIGAGLACAGLTIFLFFGCKEATRGLLKLTKKTIISIKTRLTRKEEEHE